MNAGREASYYVEMPRQRKHRGARRGEMLLSILGAWLVIIIVGTAPTYGSQAYRMTDLGALTGDSYSTASAINSAGQIVGWSSPTRDDYDSGHAFIWDAVSGMRDLGVLPGGYAGSAHDINDLGQVVGISFISGNEHAFLWDANAGMREMEPLSGRERSIAAAINNLGQIAGFSRGPYIPDDHACLWNPPGYGVIDLVWGYAFGINNLGQVVGSGFVWDPISGYRRLDGMAMDINDLGQVVVYVRGTGSSLWDVEGGIRLIPGIDYAYAINNAGQVVGQSAGSGSAGARLWSESTGLVIVSTDPDSIAHDINEAGQIVGVSGGRAVLWEVIPEPSSLAALAFGLAPVAVAALGRKRKQGDIHSAWR